MLKICLTIANQHGILSTRTSIAAVRIYILWFLSKHGRDTLPISTAISPPSVHQRSQMPTIRPREDIHCGPTAKQRLQSGGPIGILVLISTAYLSLGVASLPIQPDRNAWCDKQRWVCQTQEQPYRGPFTQPRLHFWRKRVVSSQRQRIVTGSSIQAYHGQSLGSWRIII